MTNPSEDLVLDANGIPILTDLVREHETPEPTKYPRKDEVSTDELAALLLHSETFRQQLDEIATGLTRAVHQQIELALRPMIKEAISLALDDSSAASYAVVRKQLEAALPGLLARTLQD